MHCKFLIVPTETNNKNKNKMSAKHPTQVSELPNTEFFAILKTTSVYTPGDERSLINPGHGYPASTDNYWNIEVYPTQEEWKKEIRRLSSPDNLYKEPFKAVKIKTAKINVVTEVNME